MAGNGELGQHIRTENYRSRSTKKERKPRFDDRKDRKFPIRIPENSLIV